MSITSLQNSISTRCLTNLNSSVWRATGATHTKGQIYRVSIRRQAKWFRCTTLERIVGKIIFTFVEGKSSGSLPSDGRQCGYCTSTHHNESNCASNGSPTTTACDKNAEISTLQTSYRYWIFPLRLHQIAEVVSHNTDSNDIRSFRCRVCGGGRRGGRTGVRNTCAP